MKAIKLMATVDEKGSLSLNQPLSTIKNSRVDVIAIQPVIKQLQLLSNSIKYSMFFNHFN